MRFLRSDENTISLPQFLSKLPGFVSGTPQRLKGLYLANRKAGDYPAGLGVCLEEAVAKNPEGIALIFEEREYSYKAFNAWSNRIARSLMNTGIGKGDVVAVLIENRPELLACIAALAKIGAVSSLINTSQRGKVLRHSIDLVQAKSIIVGEELMEAVEEVPDCLPTGWQARLFLADHDTLTVEMAENEVPSGWLDLSALAKQCTSDNPESTNMARPSDPLCYFYTSGTTGLPKAAVLTHGRFMKAFGGVGLACLQLDTMDRAYVTLPFYHGTALIVGWGSVLAGAAGLVMARQFSASQFWLDVRRTRTTAICYVGELCRYLLAQPEDPSDKSHYVRVMFGNGLRPALWKSFKERFGIERVLEFYGSSEGNVGFMNIFNHDCTVGFTTVPYAIVEYDLEEDQPLRFSKGFMRRVKKGEAGLLLGQITDKSPFDGYTDPEKTEKTILRNVFKHGDAWFNTGDLMRDQGFNHAQFVDRLGDTFRWKGENVSTTEVENCLSQYPQILDAVVYGVEIPNTNGRAGMAAIRLHDGEALDAEALSCYLAEHLPAYARPIFLRIDAEMETTGTFKYKKSDLKKQAFYLDQVNGQVWVHLPGSVKYEVLDRKLEKGIVANDFRF